MFSIYWLLPRSIFDRGNALFCISNLQLMKWKKARHWAMAAGVMLLLLLAIHALIYCSGYRGDTLRWIPTAQLFDSLMDKLK